MAGLVVAGCLGAWSPIARADSIGRADLDGSTPEPNFITNLNRASAFAVGGRYLYWVESFPDTVGRANTDGSDVNPSFLSVGEPAVPDVLAVGGEYVYWGSWQPGPSSYFPSPAIGRGKTDGTDIRTNFLPLANTWGLRALAVDSGHLYWAAGSGIERANLDGTGVESLINAIDVQWLAVDSEHIYWIGIRSGMLWQANLDGSDVQHHTLNVPYLQPQIAVAGGHLYWLSKEFLVPNFQTRVVSTIGRANLDGSDVQPLRRLPDEDVHYLAADGRHLYWTWSSTAPPPIPPVLPPVPEVSTLRVSPHRFRLTGRRVNGRCVSRTSANRSNRRCTRPIVLHVSYKIRHRIGQGFRVDRELPGRQLDRWSCVAPTPANSSSPPCTQLIFVGETTQGGTAGARRFTLHKRIGDHILTPGSYRLTALERPGVPERYVSFHITR